MSKNVGFSGTLAVRCGILKPKTDSLLSRAFRFFNLNRKPTGQSEPLCKLKWFMARKSRMHIAAPARSWFMRLFALNESVITDILKCHINTHYEVDDSCNSLPDRLNLLKLKEGERLKY